MDLSTILEAFGYIGSGLQLGADLAGVSVSLASWIASAFSWVSANLQGIIDLVGGLVG
jgi:hypothetical protein